MTDEKKNKEEGKIIKKLSNSQLAALIILGLIFLLVIYNTTRISSISGGVVITGNSITNIKGIDVLPKGVPKIYGEKLGVSYDDISAQNPDKTDATISVLGNFDNQITLQGDNLKRYISIGSSISCEYCCGAKAIIFSNGEAACGCAHSYAMRGLAKYLLKNHGSEYTDDEILEELGKWKVLFFPDIHATKAAVLKEQGIELTYINLASNKYRGAEKGAQSGGGEMVGGC